MKTKAQPVLALAIAVFILIGACSFFGDTAVIEFSVTDAPLDPSAVKSVNVTFSSISVNESASAEDAASSWIVTTIDPPLTLDLLDYQNGLSEALGSIEIEGGVQINQIRLGVDSVTIVESDDSVHEAVMPSATGFKIVNAFQVPLSGNIGIAIDFDLRKAVILNAQGYMVHSAIRAVVENEAGRITGSVGATGAVSVYAYADGTYTDSEAVATGDGTVFAGAYSSTLSAADAGYVLAFMDPGVYDLYAVNAAGTVVGTLADASVGAGTVTASQNF